MPLDNPHEVPFGDLEILMDARNGISRRQSWVQGRFEDGDRHCLVASLSLACGSRSFSVPSRTERRLARLLVRHLPPEATLWAKFRFFPARHRLMAFNDDPRTSHDAVLGVFDRTIQHLTEQVPACVLA